MTLEEVKEHFKDAKLVRCSYDGRLIDLSDVRIKRDIHLYCGDYWIDYIENLSGREGIVKLTEGDRLAEIVEYKCINDCCNITGSFDMSTLTNFAEPRVIKNSSELTSALIMKFKPDIKDVWTGYDIDLAKSTNLICSLAINKTMKTKLTLETARKMYSSNDESIKAFALDNYSEEELTEKKIEKWRDLGNVKGYWIDGEANIKATPITNTERWNSNIFTTKSLAESALAKAQLSQLLKEFNGDWEAEWGRNEDCKFVIYRRHVSVSIKQVFCEYNFLSFETHAKAHDFYNLHKELIHLYLMID